jgi:PadR family transcriptional regulator
MYAVLKGPIMDSRLLWGAVETLMLEVIAQGPTYGYEIAQTVTSRSKGYFELKEGSLYPALHRLEEQRLISSYWQAVDGRRRKYYKITSTGERALSDRRAEWRAFAKGMQGVLGLQFAH